MHSFLQDLRYSARTFAKNPGFTLLAVVTLALGIGANTAIFTVVNTLLLQPITVQEPERLVKVYSRYGSDSAYHSNSYPDYLDWRERSRSFSDLAVSRYMTVGLKGADKTELVLTEVVTVNYFDVLGVKPIVGRAFEPGEGRTEGSHPVAVLGYDAWRTRFGGDPGIVGKDVTINTLPFTVIGVAPESFRSLHVGIRPDIWIPIQMQAAVSPMEFPLDARSVRYLRVIGRLRPGVTLEQADAELAAITQRLVEEYPDSNGGNSSVLVPCDDDRLMAGVVAPGAARAFLSVLMALVGFVLLIACFNVANLLLTRAIGRQKEIALRLSLGATRFRILRMLLTESSILALLAGAGGLFAAVWAARLIEMLRPPMPIPVQLEIRPDGSVLLFTLAASMLTSLVFGLVPALQALSPRLSSSLRDRQAASGRVGKRAVLQRGFAVAQVGLTLVLLISAGLCLRSLRQAQDADLGFDPDNLLTLNLNMSTVRYEQSRGQAFLDEIVERAAEVPGVRTASLALVLPLGADTMRTGFQVEGYELRPDENPTVHMNMVGHGYFKTLGIPMIRGREFTRRDNEGSRPVMVVNQIAAERYWPGEDAVGKTVRIGRTQREVIGVTANSRHSSLRGSPQPILYMPMAQRYFGRAGLLVKTEGDPRQIAAPLLSEVERLAPGMAVSDIQTMREHLAFVLMPSRLLGILIGVFGLLALVLSVTGVYGVISYAAGQRRQEFGIRSALGADGVSILWMVLRQGLVIGVSGLLLGLAGAIAGTRLLTAYLHDISPTDPLTFSAVCAALFTVVLAACLLPAWRATKVDPMEALRYE